jgi:hypothetical protein
VAARAHAALQKLAGHRPEFISLAEQIWPGKNPPSISAVEPTSGIAARTVADRRARRRGGMTKAPMQFAKYMRLAAGKRETAKRKMGGGVATPSRRIGRDQFFFTTRYGGALKLK